jgi:hypothetical protein
MTGHYLLTLEESGGQHDFMTRHLIEAEDRQKVKYHYHRTLKDWGYTSAPWGGKHALRRDNLAANIYEIRKLTPAEYGFLNEFLYNWTKV